MCNAGRAVPHYVLNVGVALKLKPSGNNPCRYSDSRFSLELWLRSIVAMHFLGREETGGSSPLGASTIITMKYAGLYSVVE